MNIQRITRLLKLLQILQSGNGHNANGLARACGVCRRTTFRDLEALRAAGLPLDYDPDRDRYSIAGALHLPPINFTAAEALSLLALAKELGRDNRLPFFEPARTAAIKLQGNLPAALRDQLRDLTSSIRIKTAPTSKLGDKSRFYQQLVDARAARRVVRIEYDSQADQAQLATRLHPYQLLFCRHSWYTIGRSSFHGQVRTFNIRRIISLEPLAQRFRMPRDFNLERHLGNAWQLIPEDSPDRLVVIRFQPLVAQSVAEVIWHKTQRTEFQPDGSLLYRAKVSGLNEIVWWVLGYGDQAEVLRPADLRRLVARRARSLVAMYDGENSA